MSTKLLHCCLPEVADPELAVRARRPFLRDAALQALAHAREVPRMAGPRMKTWFRKTRKLGSKDRPVVQEALLGMVRHEALLIQAGARGPEDLHDLWCRLVEGDRFDEVEPTTPAEDFATALTLGYPIALEWLDALGEEEAAALGRAMSTRAPLTIRANRLRCTREELAAQLAEEGVQTRPTALAPDGLHIEGRHNLVALDSFRAGCFEVQDESSQLFIDALPIEPGMRVLDVCAGAGGKSLAMAARKARVEAHDVRPRALVELQRRATRAGAEIAILKDEDLEPAPMVVVDAPCSGTGRLRRDPWLRWGMEHLGQVDLQQQILEVAAELVQPGGVLAYATCSLVQGENAHPAPEVGTWSAPETRWLWPHQGGMDGFAWRIWRRET